MKIMSKPEYQEFRQKVQRFTTGANIHTVNTKLGHVINSIELLNKYKKRPNPEKEKYYRALYKNTVNELVSLMRKSHK